ncbi:immunoglobulin E-set [Baffinella frigidus]|nr:immunoglobulin E-set [Cryptophyta sp. CCMP2293]|mmetsp:Transcript_39678/g.93992  ORF Transcript_39678/g.93992 Transcript_39678/m.93992 type:complete len:267 (+) Transcript_39678:1069-1869(+)
MKNNMLTIKRYNKNIVYNKIIKFDTRTKDISISIGQSVEFFFLISPFIWPISRKVYIYTIFNWNFGGKSIYLTGNWDGWCKQIPMRRSENEFTIILPLPIGRFQYKFTVDGEWKYAPTQKIERDFLGNLNNYIDIEKLDGESNADECLSENEENKDFSIPEKKILSKNNYLKDPPNTPPHFSFLVESNNRKKEKYFTFSKFSTQTGKALRVFLNHILYLKGKFFCEKKMDLVPLTRIRIRGKFFTFVLFTSRLEKIQLSHELKIQF